MRTTFVATLLVMCLLVPAALGVTKENASNTTLYSMYPDIWIDSNNTWRVVWFEESENEGDWLLFYRTRSSAGVWSPKVNVRPNNPNKNFREFFYIPKIAVDTEGTVHIVYVECFNSTNAEDARIMYINKPAGSPWSTPVQLSLDVEGIYPHSKSPDIYIDPQNDDVHITWDQHPPDNPNNRVHCIYWCVSQNGGTSFSTAQELTSHTVGMGEYLFAWAPRIAVDSGHNVHLAYELRNCYTVFTPPPGYYHRIYYARGAYDSLNDEWDWPAPASHQAVDSSSSPVAMYYPSITIYHSGDSITPYITFVWDDSNEIDQVYSYKPGFSWLTPIPVNSVDVKITINEIEVTSSYVYVLMNQDNGSSTKLYLKQFTRSTDTLNSTIDILDTTYMSWVGRLDLKTDATTWHACFDDTQYLLGDPPVDFSNVFLSYPKA